MSQVPSQSEPRLGRSSQVGQIMEYLKFRKMITPVVIQVLFWIGLVACVISALVYFGKGTGESVLAGIVTLLLGPLVVRIYCELLIVLFRMRDLLESIRDNTRK